MLLLLIWQTTKMQAKQSPHVIPNKNQINELINKNFTTHNGVSNILIAILIRLFRCKRCKNENPNILVIFGLPPC